MQSLLGANSATLLISLFLRTVSSFRHVQRAPGVHFVAPLSWPSLKPVHDHLDKYRLLFLSFLFHCFTPDKLKDMFWEKCWVFSADVCRERKRDPAWNRDQWIRGERWSDRRQAGKLTERLADCQRGACWPYNQIDGWISRQHPLTKQLGSGTDSS